MRYFEIAGGIRVNISEEENDLLELCNEEQTEESLDERKLELAYGMLSRGLLLQTEVENKSAFIQNKLPNMWRF